METIVRDASAAAVAEAVAWLQAGEVVALPTETVYGLAGDALNPLGVARIFAAKERPTFDPLIVHLADMEMLHRVAIADASAVSALAEKFWPGPLTILLPKREIISDLVTSGSPLVAVRMPAHPIFREVLTTLGNPLAAPSANPFGRISPTRADHVFAGLAGRIPLILDGGKCQHGLESTIVYPKNGFLHILREGPISREQLQEIAPLAELQETGNASAPGQLPSHYAPRKPLILVDSADDVLTADGNGLLAFSRNCPGFQIVEVLSQNGDLVEAASRLFACLHRLDAANITTIYAEKLPHEGLGRAIMDRLNRAAAAR